MSTVLLASVVAACLCYLLYKHVIYPIWLSPLSGLATPNLLCSLSTTWIWQQRARGRELKTLYAAHTAHGPIVRLGRNEVSVVSEEGLRKIYSGGFDKHPWYQRTFFAYGHQNLVGTLDHGTHSAQKKMIARVYGKSYLLHSKRMGEISEQIVRNRLGSMLKRYADAVENVNVFELMEWVSVDLVTAYLFGFSNSTTFLQDVTARRRYFHSSSEKTGTSRTYAEDLCLSMCKSSLAHTHDEKPSSSTESTVMSTMYEQMSAAVNSRSLHVINGEVMERCASEMLDHIIATQETNTITLTYILYRLSQHPKLQTHLREELLSLQPPISTSDSNGSCQDPHGLPSPADIDDLPLLNAIVNETLRLHAANPARMPRIVPASGMELHGYYIPAGTTISTNAYCLHRNPAVFPDPLEWKPERWLHGNPGSFSEMRKWLWAFGSGPRTCIGQHFAFQVIKLIVATIYTQYTTSIVDDTEIEQSDSYNSGPVGKRLILRFRLATTM